MNKAMQNRASVNVSGLGMVTPFGIGRETAWQELQQGHSSIRAVCLNVDDLPGHRHFRQIAGGPHPMVDLDLQTEPVVELALLAAREAINDAAESLVEIPRERIGCVIGTSKFGLRSFEEIYQQVRKPSVNDTKPDEETQFAQLWSAMMPSGAASAVACEFGIRGPVISPVAACATGLLSILQGVELIQQGACDAVIAGSVDASLTPMIVGSYRRLGILATSTEQLHRSCRPFDRDRAGFVIGEGAGLFVLQKSDVRKTTASGSYGEFVAGCELTDPNSLTQPSDAREPIEHLLREVLQRARLAPGEIDYINLHGSATEINDRLESQAVENVFGRHVPCSSIKGGIGHLLGAAGSVELAVTLLAMRDGQLPPSINLEHVDPAFQLNFVGPQSTAATMKHVLKLSLGFGGHQVATIFRQSQ